MKKDHVPSSHWPLDRVIDVHPGDEGVMRAATLHLGKTTIKTSITRLCVLPVNTSE